MKHKLLALGRLISLPIEPTLIEKARASYHSKNFEQALVYADAILADDPDNKSALWTRAMAAFKLEKWVESVRALDKATGIQRPKFEGKTYSVPWDKDNTRMLLEDSLTAVSDLEAFLAGEVQAHLGFLWLARRHYWRRDRNYAKALDYYTKAMNLDPNRGNESLAYYHNERASCLSALRRDKDALFEATKAVKLHPTAWAYSHRAWAHFCLGEYKKAVLDFDAELALTRNDGHVFTTVYERRGFCYLFLGQFQQAVSDFSLDIAVSSKRPAETTTALLCRAAAYIHLGEYDKALKDLDDYIERDSYHKDLGIVLRAFLLIALDKPDFSPRRIKGDVIKVLMPKDPMKLPFPYNRKPEQFTALVDYLFLIEKRRNDALDDI